MKRKFFAIATIAVLAIVGVFVFQYATSAQRPDRNAQNQQRGNRQGGERGGRGMSMANFNFVGTVENSWVDLTFGVKVDDETLTKARPIYQATHDKVSAKMKEVQASDNMREAMMANQSYFIEAGKNFNASLKEVLTEEQFTKLQEFQRKRREQQQQRMNRFRGEGNNRRGGGGAGGGSR